MYEAAVFYVFGAVLLLSGLAVITARNPVHGALFLVLAFFTASAIWLLLRAEFLAIALVVVYVGAVMVLFLFVVMMLDINLAKLREGFWKYLPLGGLVAVLLVFEMGVMLFNSYGGLVYAPEASNLYVNGSNTRALGQLIYTDYVYAFEIAAVILLVAIVAAIALTLRKRKTTRYKDPSDQIQ